MDFLRDLGRRHGELKRRIHATRVPLGPRGQVVMGLVYFSLPVIGGYFVMDWATSRADRKWGAADGHWFGRSRAGEATRHTLPAAVVKRRPSLRAGTVKRAEMESAATAQIDFLRSETEGGKAPVWIPSRKREAQTEARALASAAAARARDSVAAASSSAGTANAKR